jgi:hypothetical protein
MLAIVRRNGSLIHCGRKMKRYTHCRKEFSSFLKPPYGPEIASLGIYSRKLNTL